MISIRVTLGLDGMKGVFKLATALWKEEAPGHRPCKKTVCKDQKGPYMSNQSSKWESDVHKLSPQLCMGEGDQHSDFLTPSPVFPPIKLQYFSLALHKDRPYTHSHKGAHTLYLQYINLDQNMWTLQSLPCAWHSFFPSFTHYVSPVLSVIPCCIHTRGEKI